MATMLHPNSYSLDFLPKWWLAVETWSKDTGHLLRQGDCGPAGKPRTGLEAPYIYTNMNIMLAPAKKRRYNAGHEKG